MKRSSPLGRDVDKVRAWVQRSRAASGRAKRPQAPLQRNPPEPKARVSGSSRRTALKRSGGWCVRPGCRSRAVQVHHVLPKGAGKWPGHVNEPANLVGVCELCHVRHERAILRLPREALPPETVEFVIAAGAEWYLEKTYPAQNEDRPGGEPGRSEVSR